MPFNRFRTVEGINVDTILGPEMKSTGEVMGLDQAFGTAFAKSQEAAFGPLPTQGTVFVSVANRDKRHVIFPVKRLADLGFELVATRRHRLGAAAQRGQGHRDPQAHRGHRSARGEDHRPGHRRR